MNEALAEMETRMAAEASQDEARAVADAVLINRRFEAAINELQCSLVKQWLQSDQLEVRERCWHEVRAIEAVRQDFLGKVIRDILGRGAPTAVDVARVEKLEASGFGHYVRRWFPAIVRWRDGR